MNTDQKNEKDLSVKIREIRGQGFAARKHTANTKVLGERSATRRDG
jgi:hypothetical protein